MGHWRTDTPGGEGCDQRRHLAYREATKLYEGTARGISDLAKEAMDELGPELAKEVVTEVGTDLVEEAL